MNIRVKIKKIPNRILNTNSDFRRKKLQVFIPYRSETLLKKSPAQEVRQKSDILDLRPWSSWTANSDKKNMELNGATLNVNKPCVSDFSENSLF